MKQNKVLFMILMALILPFLSHGQPPPPPPSPADGGFILLALSALGWGVYRTCKTNK